MRNFGKISWAFRWVILWPVLVILGINIEVWATGRGLEGLLLGKSPRFGPMLVDVYTAITAPWVTHLATLLLGGAAYEWIMLFIHRRPDFGGPGINRATKFKALSLVIPFRKNGFARGMHKRTQLGALDQLNELLKRDKLPPIPDNFFDDDELNKMFSAYLRIVSDGDRGLAKTYWTGVVRKTLDERFPPQSLAEIEQEKPR